MASAGIPLELDEYNMENPLLEENCETLQQTKIRHIDLLLVGKTGHGKSATANSILRNELFDSWSSTSSVTDKVQYAATSHYNYVIKVIDTPGMADTAEISDPVLASKNIMNQMKDAVILNPEGYHAFLLVFRHGCRFTNEEKEVVKRLKHIFGDTFVKTYCILVITHGDNFNTDKNTELRFRFWLNEQKGYFQELIKECQHRVVLFDNFTDNNIIKESQLNNLIQCVESLNTSGNRYKDKHFEQAEKGRKQFLDKTLLVLVSKELINIGLILEKISLFLTSSSNIENVNLESLLSVTEMLSQKLAKNDHEHELHRDFILLMLKIKNSIEKYSKGMRENYRLIKDVDQKLKIESKRLADILYRYVDDESDEDFSMSSTIKTYRCSRKIIYNERNTKNNVINEFECEIYLKTIINERALLESQLENIEKVFTTERGALVKTYTNLKEKCNNLLKNNSACCIL